MIDYGKFRKALIHLELQYENYRTLGEGQPQLIREAVAESVIQRFETCYDCMWKILKRCLSEEFGLPDVPNSPRPILRLAGENNLLTPPVDRWMDYADARVSTSHDYSGEKAQEALSLMGDFVRDAGALLRTLSGETWE